MWTRQEAAAWWQELRGKWTVRGAVLFACVWVLDNMTGNWATGTALPWVWHVGRDLTQRPAGPFLLIALLLLGVAALGLIAERSQFGKALIDRARPAPKSIIPPPAAPLSREERDAIHDIRVLWNDHAVYASEGIHSMLHTTIHTMRDQIYWSSLLQPIEYQLHTAAMSVAEAVNDDGTTRLSVVRQRFDAFFKAYAKALVWLADVLDKEKLALNVPEGDLPRWRRANKSFRKELRELNQRPEHRDSLLSEIRQFGGDAFIRFQDADEFPPEQQVPALQSTVNSVENPSTSAAP